MAALPRSWTLEEARGDRPRDHPYQPHDLALRTKTPAAGALVGYHRPWEFRNFLKRAPNGTENHFGDVIMVAARIAVLIIMMVASTATTVAAAGNDERPTKAPRVDEGEGPGEAMETDDDPGPPYDPCVAERWTEFHKCLPGELKSSQEEMTEVRRLIDNAGQIMDTIFRKAGISTEDEGLVERITGLSEDFWWQNFLDATAKVVPDSAFENLAANADPAAFARIKKDVHPFLKSVGFGWKDQELGNIMNELFSIGVDVIVEEFKARPKNSRIKMSTAQNFYFMAEHIHQGNAAVRATFKDEHGQVVVANGQRSGMLSKANAFQLWVRMGTRTLSALLLAMMNSEDLEGYAGTNYRVKFHSEYGGCPLAGFGTPHTDEHQDHRRYRFTWPFPGFVRNRRDVFYDDKSQESKIPEENGFRDWALGLAKKIRVGIIVFTRGTPIGYHTARAAVGVATKAFEALGMSSRIRCYEQDIAKGRPDRRVGHSRALVDVNTLQLLFEIADKFADDPKQLRGVMGKIFISFLVTFYLYMCRKAKNGIPPEFTEPCDAAEVPQLRDAVYEYEKAEAKQEEDEENESMEPPRPTTIRIAE